MNKDDAGEAIDAISENAPMRLNPVHLGSPQGTKFVDAACGRNHTLLVGSDGQVWTAGANPLGQVKDLKRYMWQLRLTNSEILAVWSFSMSRGNELQSSTRLPPGRTGARD